MCEPPRRSQQDLDWNVLTDSWVEVLDLNAEWMLHSPLHLLSKADKIRCIVFASPLDLFAAYRFLLTLLYWKADEAGGVQRVRDSLLAGKTPPTLLDALTNESQHFRMFDDKVPFLQDPEARDDKKSYSAGSLFAEFATGTNIAHFSHGRDDDTRLCLRCATIGLLRVIPWSQSGGQGISPSVHNAPPVMAMAMGVNLAFTLGLNLVPLAVAPGVPKWSGHFIPTDTDRPVPYLEAFTWNPRRIHLLSPKIADFCWRCGKTEVVSVGPIKYLKNEETRSRKTGRKTRPFEWNDPSAFYTAKAPYVTMKSRQEAKAADGSDLKCLLHEQTVPSSLVVKANPEHHGWFLIVSCTNPANNKSFDHRCVDIDTLCRDGILPNASPHATTVETVGLDGWREPSRTRYNRGAMQFVRAAVRSLSHTDWLVLKNAAYQEMHHSPAAFDVLSGLLWPLRRKDAGLPRRNTAWLVLKLMASVPAYARVPHGDASFCPLRSLPRRQVGERREGRFAISRYPISFPLGRTLEVELRHAIDENMRTRRPRRIDWADLCLCLDRLLD